MAGAAQCGVPDMRIFGGTKSSGGRMHNALSSRVDSKRAILRVLALRRRRIHNESSVETFGSAQLFLRNLVTHRARHAIFRLRVILLVLIKWQMRKNLALPAFQLCLKASNRHMADRAFVLYGSDRFRMIDRFAPHAPLPIRITRRITHHARPPSEPDGNILTRRRHDSIVTSQAAVRSLKAWLGRRMLPAAADQYRRATQPSQQW